VAVFTNLTHDHLDYHGDVESYLRSKTHLLDLLSPEGVAIVNADEPAWEGVIAAVSARTRVGGAGRLLTFGMDRGADLRAVDVDVHEGGTSFRLLHGSESAPVELPFLGGFNVENALAAAGIALATGSSPAEIARALSAAPQIPGRLEVLVRDPFTVIIDFAHTPEALERVLGTLRPLARSRLIVLFGAGGDRDRGKRPEMGEVVARGADLAIVTSDNPRNEDPETILDDITAGMRDAAFERITDRRAAIARALTLARAGDFVLLAGKGHERHQTVAGRKLPFDEREIVRDLLGRAA
jgi:UDP-N-acetylmuramoyl-L-alanyl-D-glutamate--2,6-diaminopimelate ligase